MKVRIGNVLVDTEKIAQLSAGGQLEARLLMQEIEQLRAVNPLQFYEPNGPKYESCHTTDADVILALGGNRSGKTTMGIVHMLIQMSPEELLPENLHRFKHWQCPFYCRVMTPDMERTMKPVIHQKLKDWTPKALLRNGQWKDSYDAKAQNLQLECGCRFDFLSYEMDTDKFGGAALHAMLYDEEPPEDKRWECLMRLVDFDGFEFFTMTPLKGVGTHTRRDILKPFRAGDPDIHVVQLETGDNPNVSRRGLRRKMRRLPAEQRRMREQGEFVNAEGMVYPEVLDWLVPRAPAQTYAANETLIGLDPGIRKAGLTAQAFDGERFCTYYATTLLECTVDGYAKGIAWIIDYFGLTNWTIGIDPNARARSLTNAESVETELNRMGYYPEHGQNDVDTGVLMLRRLGNHGLWVIVDDLGDFIDSLEDYPLEEDAQGLLHPAKTGHEHMADATRYAISLRAWPDEETAAGPARAPNGIHVAQSLDGAVATGPPRRDSGLWTPAGALV